MHERKRSDTLHALRHLNDAWSLVHFASLPVALSSEVVVLIMSLTELANDSTMIFTMLALNHLHITMYMEYKIVRPSLLAVNVRSYIRDVGLQSSIASKLNHMQAWTACQSSSHQCSMPTSRLALVHACTWVETRRFKHSHEARMCRLGAWMCLLFPRPSLPTQNILPSSCLVLNLHHL